MLNSISSREKLAKTFSPFTDVTNINNLALPKNKESKQDKFEKKYGIYYTAGATVAGAGILYALFRGGKLFNFTNYLKKKINVLSAKIAEETSKNQDNNLTLLGKIHVKTSLFFSNIWKKTLEGANMISNLNPCKDIAFDRFTKYTKIKPVFDRITTIFTKSAKKLAAAKYVAPTEDLAQLQSVLMEAVQSIRNIPTCKVNGQIISGEAASQKIASFAASLGEEMSKITGENFSKRFDDTVELLKGTETEFLKLFNKDGSNKNLTKSVIEKVKEWGDYLPRKVMRAKKNEFYEPLMTCKNKISNNILDLEKTISKSIDEIFYNSSLDNHELRSSYLNLKNLLKKFKNPKEYEGIVRGNVRNDILNEINAAKEKFIAIAPNNEKIALLDKLAQYIKNDQKGMVEQAVSACKILKTANPNLYNRIINQRNKFQSSFANAIDFEVNKSYNKLLDFSMHSLPTDIMSMLIGFGSVIYILANSKKTKEEKVAANLEYGIPLTGGLVISFLCNLRQVASGTGALFLGFLSSIILNRLGKIAATSYFKNFAKTKQNTNENQKTS